VVIKEHRCIMYINQNQVIVCVCVSHNEKFGVKNNSWKNWDDGSTYACHTSNVLFRKDLNLSSLGSFNNCLFA
jgi:hypothetical protein